MSDYFEFDYKKNYTFENISYDPNMSYDEYCEIFNLQKFSLIADAEFSYFRKSMAENKNLKLYEAEFLKVLYFRDLKKQYRDKRPESVKIDIKADVRALAAGMHV